MPASPSIAFDHAYAAFDAAPPQKIWPASPERRDGAGFGQAGQILHFAADEEIYADGCENSSFYKIKSGVVRTCKFRSDGRRQIDAFYLSGDIFGFEEGSQHRHSAEAISECVVIAYRWRGVDALCSADSRLARQFLSQAMQGLRRAQDHALLLGRRSAAEKVAAFLADMAARGGHGEFIDLPMARQDIADYLGLTIETVSRTLSQLERDDVIALQSARRVRVTDRVLLQRMGS